MVRPLRRAGSWGEGSAEMTARTWLGRGQTVGAGN